LNAVVVAGLGGEGSGRWAFAVNGYAEGYGIAADLSGAIAVTGRASRGVDLGEGPLPSNLQSGFAVFMARLREP